MRGVVRATTLPIPLIALLLVALLPATAFPFELEQGAYQAGVINFPTALNQPTTHTIHGTIELTDIGKPELNLYNLRYGFQYGSFQLLTDLQFQVEPQHEFDYGTVRAKLQVLSLDEFRSHLAVGAMARAVRHADEREQRIDDKTASLLIISTFELFPFDQWGGVLVNLYLDNRFFNVGAKVQLYQSIQLVAEGDHLVSTLREKKNHYRAGVSFEGLQNLYFQLLYADEGEHWLAQIGTGF